MALTLTNEILKDDDSLAVIVLGEAVIYLFVGKHLNLITFNTNLTQNKLFDQKCLKYTNNKFETHLIIFDAFHIMFSGNPNSLLNTGLLGDTKICLENCCGYV